MLARIALALGSLALVACGAVETGTADGVWLPQSDPLYEAQQAWGLPVAEGTHVEVLPVDAYLVRCEALEGAPCSPKSLEVVDHAGRAVVLREDLTAEQARFAKLHALGHLLRGENGHIDCEGPGAHVMCAHGRVNATNTAYVPELTDADFDFVAR